MGWISTSALAALSISAPLYVVAVMVVRGWATGARALAAQWFGAGRIDDVRGVLAVAILAALVIGCTVAGVLALAAPVLVGSFDR